MMNKIFYIVLLTLVSLIFFACGGDEKVVTYEEPEILPDLADAKPYRETSPYADVLKECVSAEVESQSCLLSDLPFIGQEFDSPTTDDIMNRVFVSHDWMGANFQTMLDYLPADIKILLKGVTAIVIDADIIPSYYSTLTGAIYLDPDYLWFSSGQKMDIPQKSDYRADFGNDLQFLTLARYTINNTYASSGFNYPPRTMSTIRYPLASLLYHELAHAGDFVPPSRLPLLSPDQRVADVINTHYYNNQMVSHSLYSSHPLDSVMLKGLAQVMYQGVTATAIQRTYSAATVGGEFEKEGANDFYNYSNIYEDTAMLFQETMLKYHYNVDRDVAFTVIPANELYCNYYIVKWGVRGRIGDPLVKDRAGHVAGLLLPHTDFTPFFSNLSSPITMTINNSWCDNLDLGGASKPSFKGKADFKVPPDQLKRDAHSLH